MQRAEKRLENQEDQVPSEQSQHCGTSMTVAGLVLG